MSSPPPSPPPRKPATTKNVVAIVRMPIDSKTGADHGGGGGGGMRLAVSGDTYPLRRHLTRIGTWQQTRQQWEVSVALHHELVGMLVANGVAIRDESDDGRLVAFYSRPPVAALLLAQERERQRLETKFIDEQRALIARLAAADVSYVQKLDAGGGGSPRHGADQHRRSTGAVDAAVAHNDDSAAHDEGDGRDAREASKQKALETVLFRIQRQRAERKR